MLRQEILEFALELSRDAGEFILPLWKTVTVDHKADGSEVTEADRGAEQMLRKRIGARYPDHAVLGEEFGGPRTRDSEHLWLVDPIDGTASFAIGLPLFGTLIAYVHRGEPVVGVIGMHALAETVYAARGLGCWYRKHGAEAARVKTSQVKELAAAYVFSTSLEHTDFDPRDPTGQIGLSGLYRQARRFRWSGDCVNYALLCQGRIDVALDPRMNPWDIAALAPCVQEAGGALSAIDGGTEDIIWAPNLVASATPELHEQVVQSLRRR